MVRLSKGQKEKVKEKILEVSEKYFLQDGYDNISTRKIAEEAGIAEGTLFNYFPTKAYLFLEVISRSYHVQKIEDVQDIDAGSSVNEILFQCLEKNIRMLLKLPKWLIREILHASTLIAKKAPGFLKKLAEVDYKFLNYLTELINDLIKKGLIRKCEANTAAESIYSFFVFEVINYAYDEKISKEMFYEAIKKKIAFLMKGYVV